MSRSRHRPKKKTKTPTTHGGSGWVTLSNHRRVELDAQGRLRRGLPPEFEGVHVQDISEVGRRLRKAEKKEERCKDTVKRRRRRDELEQVLDLGPIVSPVAEPARPARPGSRRGARPSTRVKRDQLDLFAPQSARAESQALVPWNAPVYSPPQQAHLSPEALERMEEERCELDAAQAYGGILQRARTSRLPRRRRRKQRRA